MMEHQPFGKEIKKLFRPHGVGEKTYAAIVVLQVVLFAVAMSLIAGYWMWKQRQPARPAPPVVVNMPVEYNAPEYPTTALPERIEITSPRDQESLTAPADISGNIVSYKSIQKVEVSINNGASREVRFDKVDSPNYGTSPNSFLTTWSLEGVGDEYIEGETVISVTAYKSNGTVLQQTGIFVLHRLVTNGTSTVLNIDWLEQPVRVNSYALFGTADFSGDVLKIGTVTNGFFSGHSMFIFNTGFCDGMGCWPHYYRVLKNPDNGEIYLLSKYSPEMYPQDTLFVDAVLPNVHIPDLEFPDTFDWQGLHFKRGHVPFADEMFAFTDEAWFTDQELRLVGTHPTLGSVYTTPAGFDEERGTNPSNAFFLRFPDNRVRSYVFDVPFMRDGKLPQITWDGGKSNSVDYASGDVRGCGGTNAYAVRTESDLRPAERLVAGGRTSTGDIVYVLKDPNDQELKDEYASWYPYNPDGPAEKPTFESFVAMKPIFYWKDPFNRWIRFKRADLQPMAECGKPVIYLYPEKEMPVHVMVGLKGEMTVSEPEHGKKGWDVLAKTDGYVVNQADGKTYPNLYWEGTGVGYKTPKQGFVVPQKDVAGWLEKTLAEIGFTERESAEFREFWVPRLPQSPYLFITFVPQSDFDRDAPLSISPKPDTVSRVFMEYHPLYAPETVEPLPLPKIERRGFTVVEWGGALR